MNVIRIVQAIYDYTAQEPDELSFKEGDLLWILPKTEPQLEDEPGWIHCTIKLDQFGDQAGNVPENYVDEPVAIYAANALYDYTAQNIDETTMLEGDSVDVLQEVPPDMEWVIIRHQNKDSDSFLYGLVPKSYIERVNSGGGPVPPHPEPSPPVSTLPSPPPDAVKPDPPGATAAPSIMKIATVLYEYTPQQDDEVHAYEGETCMVMEAKSPDPLWCYVRIMSSKADRSGCEGLVPTSYLEIKTLSKSPAALSASPAASKSTRLSSDNKQPKTSPSVSETTVPATDIPLNQKSNPPLSLKPPIPLTPKPPLPIESKPVVAHIPHTITHSLVQSKPALPPPPSIQAQVQAQLKVKQATLTQSATHNEHITPPPKDPIIVPVHITQPQSSDASHIEDTMDPYQRQLAAEEDRARQRRLAQNLPDHKTTSPPLPARPPALPSRPEPSNKTIDVSNTGASDLPNPTSVRIWLDLSGVHKTEAAFEDFDGSTVKLFKTNGVKIDVPITALSKDDQILAYRMKGMALPPNFHTPSPPVPRSARTSVISITNNSNATTSFNGFDWLAFSIGAGLEQGEAHIVALKFVAEKLDASCVADLSREILKGLGVREGDILRILKYCETYRASRARESEREAELIARIEDFAKAKGSATTINNNVSSMSSRLSGMSLNNNPTTTTTPNPHDQILSDEAYAIKIQQEELAKAMNSLSENGSSSTSSVINPRPSGQLQPTMPINQSSSSISAPTRAPLKSTLVPTTAQPSITAGANPMLGSPPSLPFTSMNVNYVPIGNRSGIQQSTRPASTGILPPPLIPTSNPPAFVPTSFTGSNTRPMTFPQQQQQQPTAQQQFMYAQAQATAQNQANISMLAQAMMSGQPPRNVSAQSTGRASWQNATPDNPFGKPIGTSSSVNIHPGYGMQQPISNSTGMNQSYSQPTNVVNPSGMSGSGMMQTSALGFTNSMGMSAMQGAGPMMMQHPGMIQPGMQMAQQHPHMVANMMQTNPSVVANAMTAFQPGMPGLQSTLPNQQANRNGDPYDALRQYQGYR